MAKVLKCEVCELNFCGSKGGDPCYAIEVSSDFRLLADLPSTLPNGNLEVKYFNDDGGVSEVSMTLDYFNSNSKVTTVNKISVKIPSE